MSSKTVVMLAAWWAFGVGCRSEPVAVTPDTAVPPVSAPTAPDTATSPDAATAAPSAPVPLEVSDAERARVERALVRIQKGGEAWYGVYVMGKKVGHGRMAWRAPTADEAKVGANGVVAVAEFEMEMAVSGGGNANTIRVEERRMYGATWPHALVASEFRQNANGFVEERRGVAGPTETIIARTIGGKAEPERKGPATAETLVDALRAAPLETEGLVYGEKRVARSWSWERESDETLAITPLRQDVHMRAGVEQAVAILQVKYEASGVVATTTVSGGGDVLEMSLGAAITMKLEEKSVAQSGITGLDVMGSGIESPEALGDPSKIDELVLELVTAGEIELPASANQKVERLAPDRLRVTRVRGPGDVATEEDLKEALADDPTVDMLNPAIQAQSATLVAAAATPADKVRAVASWVFDTLDKKLATHLPTASRVLEAKVGDCTEHTWLTVALLRAAGVPARPVYGVAYAGDREKSFAYHAWVEVALDGRWVWIDPTWGQSVADATHIELGDDLGSVAPSLGAITIDKVER